MRTWVPALAFERDRQSGEGCGHQEWKAGGDRSGLGERVSLAPPRFRGLPPRLTIPLQLSTPTRSRSLTRLASGRRPTQSHLL